MSEPPQNPYQPYQPQQPAGPGGVPWGPPPDHPQAVTVLILGALGMMLCQLIAPIAWVMGGRVRKEIDAANGALGGRQLATVGWVLGIVGTCLMVAMVVFLVLYVVGMAVFIGSSAASNS